MAGPFKNLLSLPILRGVISSAGNKFDNPSLYALTVASYKTIQRDIVDMTIEI